eukprot:g692.t1
MLLSRWARTRGDASLDALITAMADSEEPTAIERETQELLRSIRDRGRREGARRSPRVRKSGSRTGAKRKRRVRARDGDGMLKSESEPALGRARESMPLQARGNAANAAGESAGAGPRRGGLDPSDAVRQRERGFRDMPYERQAWLARQDAGSFVPMRHADKRMLQEGVALLDEEIARLEAVEGVQDEARARAERLGNVGRQRREWAGQDIAAARVQRVYRGHIGRRRGAVAAHQRSIAAAWTEVRDSSSGEVWFYNVITQESQWEAPVNAPAGRSEADAQIPGTAQRGAAGAGEGGEESTQRPSTAPSLPPLSARSNSADPLAPFSRTPRASELHTADLSPLVSKSVTQLPPMQPAQQQQEQQQQESFAPPPADELESVDAMSVASVDDGGDDGAGGDTTPRFFLADGSHNPRLRDTIQAALKVSKYDSVSTLLAAGPMPSPSRRGGGGGGAPSLTAPNSRYSGAANQGKMVAVMGGKRGRGSKAAAAAKEGTRASKLSGGGGPPAVREVGDAGFDQGSGGGGASASRALAPAPGQKRLTKEVCFGCWSASRGNCKLHKRADGAVMKAEDSVLLCANWEVDALRRKYRAEEIQEIFMKQGKSLRFDKARKQFLTVIEMKHPIYRALDLRITWESNRLWRKVHIKRWLSSFIDLLRVGKVPGTENSDTPKLLRLKNTLFNYRWVQRYSEEVHADHPRPPVTARVETREVKFCVCIDPDPPHGMLIHGGGEGRAFAPRFTKPLELYRPRVYELPAPRSIPMPEPSYAEEPPLPVPNRFVDEMENWSWFERLAARTAVQACQMAMTQIEACTPPKGSSALRRTKYPPPISIKFANFARKPNPPHNMAVGGLCAELTVTQIVSTYVPPQFGGFTVTDRRAFAPTANLVLEFLSLECPAVMAKYVQRALEHVMNIRKAPAITCSCAAKVETMLRYPEDVVATGMADESGKLVAGPAAWDMLVRHYNGNNRPQQTGETKRNGFRTTHPSAGLARDSETDALAFTPSVDVATPNLPSANRSETTHADRHYPFCEPSNRDNTTLDFFHLLLAGKSTRNQGQVFTTLGWQDPGLFGVKCDLEAPMGPCNCIVYRSWAFHQESPVEEFVTDDGLPYWYDRKTGETFWERPLLEAETRRDPDDGGIDGTVVEGAGEVASLGIGLESAPYGAQEIRKYMLKSMEDDKEFSMRHTAVKQHIAEHGKPPPPPDTADGGVGGGALPLPPSEQPLALPAPDEGGPGRRMSITGEDLGTLRKVGAESAQKKHVGQEGSGAGHATHPGRRGDPANKPRPEAGPVAAPVDVNAAAGALVAAGHGAAEAGTPLPAQMSDLVQSISSALGAVLPKLGGSAGPQELLQLGLGLGMGLSAKHQGALSSLAGAGPGAAGVAGAASADPGPGGDQPPPKLPPVGDLYKGYAKEEDAVDAEEDAEAPMDEAEARAQALQPGPTPDEDVPLDADINYTHTASQSVDYLPYFPNLNEAKSVGCVKPRAAIEDWLAIGFDPWSAGKQPLSCEFIEDLEAQIAAEEGEEVNPKSKHKFIDMTGLDEVKEIQTQQNKDARDMEMMATWVRHGKYGEIENMLDSPEWTQPIDAKDIHGNTLLSIAAQNGNKRIAKLCLRRGAEINTQNLVGQSPLHFTFAYGFEEMAEYLISKGADDRLTNADGLTCYEGLSSEAVDTL